VLVDRDGRLRGIVTVGMVADWFRADTGGEFPGASGSGDWSAAAAARA